MKRIFSTILFSLIAGISMLVYGQHSDYDVYLMIGQSNMAGRGEMTEADKDIISGVYILDDRDSIVPASAPLNIYSSVRKKKEIQGVTPAMSFCKEVAEKTSRKILLVVNARGGTSIERWMKDYKGTVRYSAKVDGPEKDGMLIPSLYEEAVRRTKIAMQYGRLKGILWHQGESNSEKDASKQYLSQLSAFVSDLRNDLDAPDVPFVAGEIYEGYKNAVYFNKQIRKISRKIDNAYCVSSKGCTSKSDQLHFSRDGQILLGERYAEIILDKVYGIKID